jgi:hypothetical protein
MGEVCVVWAYILLRGISIHPPHTLHIPSLFVDVLLYRKVHAAPNNFQHTAAIPGPGKVIRKKEVKTG